MVVILREILGIMLLMDLESILINQGTNMKDYGRIIWLMGRDKLIILMVVATMVNF